MDKHIEREAARKAKAMTRQAVIIRAINGDITWTQAAVIIGISTRQMRRIAT